MYTMKKIAKTKLALYAGILTISGKPDQHLSDITPDLRSAEQKPYMTSGLLAVVTRTYRSKRISR